MISWPLIGLLVQSFRGRVVHFVRMLRHPRYLLGFLAGIAWLLLLLGPVLLGSESAEVWPHRQLLENLARLLPAFCILASFGLALLLSIWWLMQWGCQPLTLRESEIHLLIPAPVPKRQVLQYAILKNQPRILVSCLFMSFLVGTGNRGYLLGFLSYWLFLTNWDLHAKARNLWIARNQELPGNRAWIRRIGLIGGILLYWILFIFLSRKLMPVLLGTVLSSATFLQIVQVVSDAISESWLSVLLAPFVVFLGLHFTSSVVSTVFVSGLVVNLLLIVIQNEWVVRSATRFEEAALEKARRDSELRDGTGRYRSTSFRRRLDIPFSLQFVSSPETAVIWKNLLASTRIPLRRQVLMGFLAVTVVYLSLLLLPLPEWMYGVSLVIGLVLFFFFPMFGSNSFRNDFRTDLTNLELVRSWPTGSWRLFVAEIAGPAVQIGLYSVLGAGITLVSQLVIDSLGVEGMRILPERLMEDTPRVLVLGWLMLGAAPCVLLTGAMCCAMHNLLALNFPGWVPLGGKRQDAAANLGQNLLITIVIMLSMALGIFPSAVLLGVTLRIQLWWLEIPFSFWEVPLLGLVTSLPILFLLTVMIALGGWSWERLDPSRELLSET